MREVTMTLKIDQIGRVGIPKVIRDEYNILAGDLVELKLVVDDEPLTSSIRSIWRIPMWKPP